MPARHHFYRMSPPNYILGKDITWDRPVRTHQPWVLKHSLDMLVYRYGRISK